MKLILTAFLALLTINSTQSQSKFAIGVNGGVSIPVGEFTRYYEVGYGANAQFFYGVSEDFLLSLTVGYDKWNVDQDAINKRLEEQEINFMLELDSYFKIIPFYIGARYYMAKGKHRPFFTLDFGGYSYEFKLSGTASNVIPDADFPGGPIPEQKETGTQTSLALGLGYFYRVTKHFYLEIFSKYNVLTDAFTINEPDQIYDPDDPTSVYGVLGTQAFISVNLGANYRF
ncbi:MAG: outer membrane beta-barrel protein [Ignavibacterium sp.]|nr:MAG: outer membrane beta-barrel protein [Ignavibacterium sp.]